MSRNPNFLVRESCPGCTSRNIRIVYVQELVSLIPDLLPRYESAVAAGDFEGIVYTIMQCQGCTLFFQRDIPTPAFFARLYARENTPENEAHKRRGALSEFARRASEAERLAVLSERPPHRLRILEVGSGWGLWAQMAAAYGFDVHAVDTQTGRLMGAARAGIHVHHSSEELPDESFDCLYSDQVLEHIADPRTALKTAVAKLARGGLARIAVPDASRALALLRSANGRPVKALWPFEHINGFTHRALEQLCRDAGLSIIPGLSIARTFISHVRLGRDLDYIQEACKSLVGQTCATTLYLRRD